MQVVQADTLQVAIDKVKELKPQIIFVKTYSEARMLAESLGAVAWWSRASEEAKTMALEHLENGGILVSTYGLSVGLNLKVRGKCIERIVLFGCPWGLSALVQAASRIREGGTAYVIACDLKEQATSGKPGEKELAALLLIGYIDEIFDAFGTAVTVPRSVTTAKPTPNYQDCRADAMVVQGTQLDGTIDECILCGGSDHCEANCQHMRGLCYTCGLSGHPAKSCPMVTKVPACPTGFCTRCKLPIFKVAGVDVHHTKRIGMDCNNTALAQKVKMMLLCGRARGVQFGPSGSSTYFERLRWATSNSPPNIITLLARVAGQPILATPSPVTPQQAERIRRNRDAALQRLNSSPVPTTPSPATFSPVTLGSTPPTKERRVVCSDRAIAAAGSVYAALARKMPSITPSSQCFKCAGAHSADQCRAPVEERISDMLFAAKCCAQCALPLTKIGQYNLHPSLPGKSCNGSRFFVNMLMRQPIGTISNAFRSGNLEQQLELLASFIPKP
jgi:hypothetical protein